MKRIAVILLATGALAADTQQEEFRRVLKKMDVFEAVKTAWTCGRFRGVEETLLALKEHETLSDVEKIRKGFPDIDIACKQFETELKAAKVIK